MERTVPEVLPFILSPDSFTYLSVKGVVPSYSVEEIPLRPQSPDGERKEVESSPSSVSALRPDESILAAVMPLFAISSAVMVPS